MLDGLTLDQLRTFIAAADEGSFSAAGRRLRRAQSVVSQTLANLELQLGVGLFDRSARYPQLTDAGRLLLNEARVVADRVDTFKARARTIREGLEPELAVVVDVMYPMAALTRAVGSSRERYPHTPVRLYVEALGGVVQPVLDGRCRIGIMGSLPLVPGDLAAEPLCELPFVSVVAPAHPLARHKGPVAQRRVEEQVQIVLTDRSPLTAGRDFEVVSPQTWRVADLGAKLAFLRAGFGWGHMPLHMVEQDLARGELVRIRIAGAGAIALQMKVVYRRDYPPGPAGRAFIERLAG